MGYLDCKTRLIILPKRLHKSNMGQKLEWLPGQDSNLQPFG